MRGWDAFRAWYQRRREAEGQGFSYELGDVLATADHAVAFISLRAIRSGRPHAWQQVAVYRIDHGRIAEIWLFEDQPRAIGA